MIESLVPFIYFIGGVLTFDAIGIGAFALFDELLLRRNPHRQQIKLLRKSLAKLRNLPDSPEAQDRISRCNSLLVDLEARKAETLAEADNVIAVVKLTASNPDVRTLPRTTSLEISKDAEGPLAQ